MLIIKIKCRKEPKMTDRMRASDNEAKGTSGKAMLRRN